MKKAARKRHPVQPTRPQPPPSNRNTQSCAMVQCLGPDAVRLGHPGCFCIVHDEDEYLIAMRLPGGGFVRLPIGLNEKPAAEPSWSWDGNRTAPTLQPSVWFMKNSGRADEWHGWIRNGRMESC